MGRVGWIVNHAIVWLVIAHFLQCSEFPERECCDPIYPLIPELDSLPPASPTTTLSASSSSYSVGAGGASNTGILPGRSGESTAGYVRLSAFLKQKLLFNLISREIEISPVERSASFLDIEFPFEKFSVSFCFSPHSIASALMDINSIQKVFPEKLSSC